MYTRVGAVLDEAERTGDFLLGTGARPGEALALRWEDLDLDAGVASICRSLSRPGGKYEFREPKAERSTRTVRLAAGLVAALKAHKGAQAERRMKRRDVWVDEDLVFAGPLGGPIDETALYRRAFTTVRRAAKLPETVTMYSLRHSFATLALAAGASIHEVAAAMGHTTPALVLSTYGHALPKRRGETFKKVAALVFGG